MNTSPQTLVAKPSIVKDALYGLLSATIIGLIASLTFILTVLLLSSQAFASSQTDALTPAPDNLTAPLEREYFLIKTPHISTIQVAEKIEV